MIECNTIEEALKVKDVFHIEAGVPVRAYVKGDVLPAHCIIEPGPEIPSEIEQLKARIVALEAKVG